MAWFCSGVFYRGCAVLCVVAHGRANCARRCPSFSEFEIAARIMYNRFSSSNNLKHGRDAKIVVMRQVLEVLRAQVMCRWNVDLLDEVHASGKGVWGGRQYAAG